MENYNDLKIEDIDALGSELELGTWNGPCMKQVYMYVQQNTDYFV